MNTFRGEVEVNIGGRVRLIKFGTNSLALFSQKTGKDLSEIDAGLMSIRDLIWSGLVAGAKKRKEEADFDEWEVGDWLDDMDQSEFDKISEAITNSMPKENESKSKKK